MLWHVSAHRLSKTHARRPFSRFAQWVAVYSGRPVTFVVALTVICMWVATGPFFGYSDTWQLVINTGTTIITFLMVFLIQNTQNRESIAMQIKLDELIRSDADAHNALLDLEELTEKELNDLRNKYERLAADARAGMKKGKKDTGIREIEN